MEVEQCIDSIMLRQNVRDYASTYVYSVKTAGVQWSLQDYDKMVLASWNFRKRQAVACDHAIQFARWQHPAVGRGARFPRVCRHLFYCS